MKKYAQQTGRGNLYGKPIKITGDTFSRGEPVDFRSCRNCVKHNECQDLMNLTKAVPEYIRAQLKPWQIILDVIGTACEDWGETV